MKLKHRNCDEHQKTQSVKKLKKSTCDKKKLKLWQNSTQMVTKLKISRCDKTKKLKLRQNSKTQIVTKLKKSNFDTCQAVAKLKLGQN